MPAKDKQEAPDSQYVDVYLIHTVYIYTFYMHSPSLSLSLTHTHTHTHTYTHTHTHTLTEGKSWTEFFFRLCRV